MIGVKSVDIKLITPDDPEYHDLEGFDHTKLSAVNTCPTWGITRYGMHRRMPSVYGDTQSVPTALAAGHAAHEAFAAARIAHLCHSYPEHARHHATRIYGKSRAETLLAVIREGEDQERHIRNAALEALYTSGFEDNPYDRRRTLANLEACISAYTASYDYRRFPVWVADRNAPTGPIGVEQYFAILLTYGCSTGLDSISVKYTGRLDGLHWNKEEGSELILMDNKTAARIDDAWVKSWDISHQITGYIVAASLFSKQNISRAVIQGVQLPLPKQILNGIQDVWTVREMHHKARWVDWVWFTYRLYQTYKDDPISAPKFSHSCNRYFRPCAMIPFCYADHDEQEQILSEMVVDKWDPLTETTDE